MALTEVNVRNNDGEVVFLLRFFDPRDGDFTSETNSTRNVSQAEIRAVTQAAQYWTGVLKPRGTMPGYQDANNPGQPVVINIGTINENNAWGDPLVPIESSQAKDPYLVHLSTALLADGTNIAPTTSGHGVLAIGTGLNTSSNSLIQSGRVASDVTTVAIHEFGHLLGIFSSMDSRGEDVARRADLVRFPQELTRYQSHLRDSNGNSSVPGAHPNVPGKPVDYDPTQGKQYIFDMGDPNSPSQPADFTFVGQNTLAVYYDYNEKLIGDKKEAGEGVPIQGLVPNPYFLMGVPGADRWIYSNPDTLSHIDARNSTMSWQTYRNYPMFLEVELAVMQDLGYDINRRDLFGRSYYVDGDGTTVTNNSAEFHSLSAYGIGLHLFASNLNIVQHGNIFAGGPGATGIRVDGVGNTLTIAPGTSINAGLPTGYKLASENQSNIFRNYGEDVLLNNTIGQGVEGIGLLVSYGKDHHIVHRGSIIAQGKYGAGVRFDFGEPLVGARLESYAYDPNYGYMEDGNLIGGFPEDIQGPLVKAFDITGTIKGSKVRADSQPTFESKNYMTITVKGASTAQIMVNQATGMVENFNPLYDPFSPLHLFPNSVHDFRYTGTGDGGPDPPYPDYWIGDAARGIYGWHITIDEPQLLPWLAKDPASEVGGYSINSNELLIIIWDDNMNLVEIKELQWRNPPLNPDTGLPDYAFDQDARGCFEIFEYALDDFYLSVQPTVSMDILGGTIYIAGPQPNEVRYGGAHVETINIMKGANIEGDIISFYADDQGRGTKIILGLKPDAEGKATSTPDASFHFVFKDNINYVFPYFEKAFDVLPHTLELYGSWDYLPDENGIWGWKDVGDNEGRFALGDDITKSRIDLHFVGGFTEFGTRETFPMYDWLEVSVSNVYSVLIDYGATLELGAVHTTSQTGLERIITRTLKVADSFVNNGRLSGESGIWDGGGWIWKEGDPDGRVGGTMVYDKQTGWVGKLGGGIWINDGEGTLVNRGTIAPGPNNGYGELHRYVNNVHIPGHRIGTLAIAGNLDMRSQNSAYEVTITDGRYEKATSPGWDMHPYWYTNPVTGVLSLETADPTSPWNIDPVTGLPLNNDRDIIGGGWGAGASDRLVVSGTTQLGGTLRVYVTPGDYSPNPTTYTIIRSEGGYATGLNFENVEHYIGFLTFEPFGLNASKTYINPYNSKELQFTVIRDADYFTSRGKTYNEISAATAIGNSMFDSYQVAFSLADNRNTTEDLRNMYHQIAGAIRANSLVINLWNPSEVLFPGIGWGNGQMETGNRGRVDWDRIAGKKAKILGQTARCERVGSLWGDILNTSLNAESDGNSDAYSFNRTGFMVGSDWSMTPYSAIGAILSYHNSTLNQVGDKVKSDDYLLGAYFVAAPFNEFEFKAYIGLGCQEYASERRIYNANIITDRVPLGNGYTDVLRGVNDRYTGKTGGNSFNVSLELARPLELHPTFILRPTLGVDVQHVWQSGYTENNFGEVPASYGSNTYALRYLRSHYNRDLLRAGFSSESSGPRGGIRMRAFYVSQIGGDQYPTATARFATGGERFTVRGVDMGKGYLHFGVGFNYWLDGERTSSLVFDYDANIYGVSHKVNAHLVSVGLVQNF